MAAGALVQQLREALASEKQSKATAIEVLEEEMQAQRAVAQEATQQELHDGEERWSSELATQALREETAVRGLKEEVEVLKLQAEHWRLLEVAEKATKDQTEASLLSSQLAAGEQQVQLYRLRGEAAAEAEAQMVISRLEMSLEEGARHQKEAIELRAMLGALRERCQRQEQALARQRATARSNLPRPPPLGRAARESGALRGLASRVQAEVHLKTVNEEAEDAKIEKDAFSAEGSISEASFQPDVFTAARDLQEEGHFQWRGEDSPTSSILDAFAVARGSLPREPSTTSLSEASLDPFAVVRGNGSIWHLQITR